LQEKNEFSAFFVCDGLLLPPLDAIWQVKYLFLEDLFCELGKKT